MRLLAAAASIVIFVGVVEAVLRLTGVDPFFQNRFFILNRALDYPEIFKKDHDVFWRLRPNRTVTSKFFIGRTYHINEQGLHGPDVEPKGGRRRIITMGNSCTFGWGVAYEDSYPRRLEKKLEGGWDVVNGAVPGYTSLQGKRFYGKVLGDFKPDIVTVLFAFNDHWAAAGGIPDKKQEMPPQWLLDIQNSLGRLHTYRVLKKALLSAVEPDPDSLFSREAPVYRVGIEDFHKNLEEIGRMVQEDGARPIFLTSPIPSLDTYYPPGYKSNLHTYHELYNEMIRDAAGSNGWGLVDLARAFDHYRGLFDDPLVDPIHFNAGGHELAAELIYEYLQGTTDPTGDLPVTP